MEHWTESIPGMAYTMSEGKPLIYIVDDSNDYRLIVSLIFRRSLNQYRIQCFESGTALCAHVRTGTDMEDVPCLILMDNNMPGLSGPQTIAILKQQSNWKEIPTIIISSSLSAEEQQEAYASGADFYMQKPITMNELKEQLGQLCQYWTEVDLVNRRSGC